MSSLKSNGKKQKQQQHHYGGAGSDSENSNQKMIMSIVGIFCFIVLIWFVYRRGQDTCPVSSTSTSGTRAGRKANMMRAGAGNDPCDGPCQGGDPDNYNSCASCVNKNRGNTHYALNGQKCNVQTNCVYDQNDGSQDIQCVITTGTTGICTES